MVHKPENTREHLVKGVCPYRAGRNACEMGPGCLPEATGPKKRVNKRLKNDKKRKQNLEKKSQEKKTQ